MKKIYYHKLIRDRVPANMRAKGVQFEIRKLSPKEYGAELLKKVGEEASGLLLAKNKKDLIFELADIEEVLRAVKKEKKITAREIRGALQENMRKKGGFRQGIFLVWSADTGYQTNERKYKN